MLLYVSNKPTYHLETMTISTLTAAPVSLLDWIQCLAHSLETARRTDGSPHTAISESSHWDAIREDLTEIIYAAHDHESPNEWRYATVAHIAQSLLEFSLRSDKELDVEDYRELSWEIAEAGTDSYTSDQLEWIGSNICRVSFHQEDLPNECLAPHEAIHIGCLARLSRLRKLSL